MNTNRFSLKQLQQLFEAVKDGAPSTELAAYLLKHTPVITQRLQLIDGVFRHAITQEEFKDMLMEVGEIDEAHAKVAEQAVSHARLHDLRRFVFTHLGEAIEESVMYLELDYAASVVNDDPELVKVVRTDLEADDDDGEHDIVIEKGIPIPPPKVDTKNYQEDDGTDWWLQ